MFIQLPFFLLKDSLQPRLAQLIPYVLPSSAGVSITYLFLGNDSLAEKMLETLIGKIDAELL